MSIARSSFFELYHEVLQDLDAQELKKNETHLVETLIQKEFEEEIYKKLQGSFEISESEYSEKPSYK